MSQPTIWTEKYRCTNLNTYVGNEHLKSYIADCIAKNDIPHLMFVGTAGTGKTTLAKLIVKNIECDFLYINASDERGIDTIREKIVNFASASSFKPLKVIILDEADYITATAQAALRNVMETYSLKTRFIMTANYVERIIPPLQSRCQVFKIEPPTKREVAKHLVKNILEVEKIEYEAPVVAEIINKFYPDIRKIINVCQQSTNNGKLEPDYTVLGENLEELTTQIVAKLAKPTKNSWKEIRQLIADSEIHDFGPIYSELYSQVDKYCPNSAGDVSIQLAQYLWSHNTVTDKELNFMACISQLLNIK